MLTLISCNGKDDDSKGPGPSVTSDEAVEIAKDNFNIITIDRVEIRHLSDEEFDEIPQEKITVVVNSNEKKFNYTSQ